VEKLYSSVLEALPPAARERLWERSVVRSLDPGAFLYLAGDEAERVHLVTEGLMKFTSSDGDGRETILGLAVPGDLVGELAALDGLRQPFDVVAVSHCGVVGFDPAALIDAVASHPGAAVELASVLAGRTRWICETAMERASREVPARLAGRLLHLAELLGRVRVRPSSWTCHWDRESSDVWPGCAGRARARPLTASSPRASWITGAAG